MTTRSLGVCATAVLAFALVVGVGAEGAPTGAASLTAKAPPSKPVQMPSIRGKRGKGPTGKRKAGRVMAGKGTKGHPASSSPGGLVPTGGVLRWHGWQTQVMRTVGKIYPAECSGTVIGVNIVLTAAHCLYDQERCAEFTGNTFVPGMSASTISNPRHIRAPWGIWSVSRWWIPDGFRCEFGKFRYLDWAILQIAPKQGRQIGNVTGWFEAWWNTPGARLYITGYPASGFWATARGLFGRSQYVCDVSFDGHWEDVDETANVAWAYVVPCPMNGGVSGGPWFIYHNSLKRWVIGGVSGWCVDTPCTPVSRLLISRYLDDNFRVFWESVKPQL